MDYINIILAFLFILAYTIMSYFQIKNLKEKTIKVIEGDIENEPLNKLIKKAQASSKNRFVGYMCFQGMLFSTIMTIVLIAMDLLIKSYGFDIIQYLFLLLFLSVVFTLTGIAKANSIWKQLNSIRK